MQKNTIRHQVQFQGNSSDYYLIWLKNVFFTIITLGIYGFWAIVNNNKYFYENTEINHYRFAFHGQAKQYAKGFFLAIAFYLIYIFLFTAHPLAGGLFLLACIGFLPWLIVKSLTFRARIISLHHVHFDFNGGVGRAAVVYLLIPALLLTVPIVCLVLVTHLLSSQIANLNLYFMIGLYALFFLALPGVMALIRVFQYSYMVNHTLFGSQAFSATFKRRPFIIINYMAMLSVIPFLLIIAYNVYRIFMVIQMQHYYGYVDQSAVILPFLTIYFMFFAAILTYSAILSCALRNVIFRAMRLNDLTFESTLSVPRYVWILLSNLLMCVFTLGLATPFARIRVAKYVAENTFVIGDFSIEADSTENADRLIDTDYAIDAIVSTI